MASNWYDEGLYQALDAGVSGRDIRTLLLKDTYSFDPTHATVADVIAGSQEISVSGYSRFNNSAPSVAKDGTNHRAYMDLDDSVFTGLAAGQDVGFAVVYEYNASDASATPIALLDFSDTPTNGSAFTVVWEAVASGGVAYVAA